MKRTVLKVLLVATLLSALVAGQGALAERISGKVSYIGTEGEYHADNAGYQAVFRFRVSESVCGNDKSPKDRWVQVRSGRMDGPFVHNSDNFKNAYSTVMTSLLSGKSIEVDGVPSCDATKAQTIDLWHAGIGLYK